MTRRTRPTPARNRANPEAIVRKAIRSGEKIRVAARQAAPVAPCSIADSKAPSGKLALLLERIDQPEGSAMTELVGATGWQAHTIRAAFSRLRQRGFAIALVTVEGRKVYQLNPARS